MSNKHFFLDLEATIIHSWEDRQLCNVPLIRSIIDKQSIQEVHIFSYAIDDQKDRAEFNNAHFKGVIEEALGVKILQVPTVEEIMRTIFKQTGVQFERYEFKSIWGKLKGFQDYCQAKFERCHCTLLDDRVPTTSFVNYEKLLRISTVKI